MPAERTYLADGGGTGKTRAAAHSQYNVRAVHRTMLGTGGALRMGVGWARFCTPSVAQCTLVPKCRKCEIYLTGQGLGQG